MRIKVSIGKGLIISLIITLIPAVAFSAQKIVPGGACKTFKQEVTYQNRSYTCIKSSKKMVWDKGVAIPKPAPTPKAPTSFDDLVANYQGISYAAWSKSRTKILESTKTDMNFKLVLGPNSELTFKEPTKAIDLITRLYSGYAKSADIYFLGFNFADRDWAVAQMDSIMPTAGSHWIYDMACVSKPTCWGGGSFSNTANRYLIVETMGSLDLNHASGTLEAHEFTHAIQQMTMGAARPPQAYLYDPWLPTWYWEGQAEFSQNAAIWFNSFDTYTRDRRSVSLDLFKNTSFDAKYIQNYFVLNAPDNWKTENDQWRQYDLGAMFIEILTALKGPNSTMEMWKLAGSGVSFDTAFEQVYGLSFSKALPVISKAISLEIGRG